MLVVRSFTLSASATTSWARPSGQVGSKRPKLVPQHAPGQTKRARLVEGRRCFAKRVLRYQARPQVEPGKRISNRPRQSRHALVRGSGPHRRRRNAKRAQDTFHHRRLLRRIHQHVGPVEDFPPVIEFGIGHAQPTVGLAVNQARVIIGIVDNPVLLCVVVPNQQAGSALAHYRVQLRATSPQAREHHCSVACVPDPRCHSPSAPAIALPLCVGHQLIRAHILVVFRQAQCGARLCLVNRTAEVAQVHRQCSRAAVVPRLPLVADTAQGHGGLGRLENRRRCWR